MKIVQSFLEQILIQFRKAKASRNKLESEQRVEASFCFPTTLPRFVVYINCSSLHLSAFQLLRNPHILVVLISIHLHVSRTFLPHFVIVNSPKYASNHNTKIIVTNPNSYSQSTKSTITKQNIQIFSKQHSTLEIILFFFS